MNTPPKRPATPPRRPTVPAGAARRSVRRPSVRGGVEVARATIPTCLVLAALLPTLGGVWFALPTTSSLKVGEAPLAVAMICGGLGAAVAAVILMAHVARRYR